MVVIVIVDARTVTVVEQAGRAKAPSLAARWGPVAYHVVTVVTAVLELWARLAG